MIKYLAYKISEAPPEVVSRGGAALFLFAPPLFAAPTLIMQFGRGNHMRRAPEQAALIR